MTAAAGIMETGRADGEDDGTKEGGAVPVKVEMETGTRRVGERHRGGGEGAHDTVQRFRVREGLSCVIGPLGR